MNALATFSLVRSFIDEGVQEAVRHAQRLYRLLETARRLRLLAGYRRTPALETFV